MLEGLSIRVYSIIVFTYIMNYSKLVFYFNSYTLFYVIEGCFALLCVQFSCSVVSDYLGPHESEHIHHQLPELTQIHVYQVSDSIQPSHPLWSPSPPAHNPSQHQSLFQ